MWLGQDREVRQGNFKNCKKEEEEKKRSSSNCQSGNFVLILVGGMVEVGLEVER